ncbi:hypothetical protein HZV92_001838 [Salmonella enterica]|nr:hypothetical protein [Salmonella enterica]EFQ6618177.1 hypothetical protein [Salmonella enterica]
MNDIKDDLIELERERYKFLQELEGFQKNIAILEEWSAAAENDPQARENLQRFDELYGQYYEEDMASLTDKMNQVELCYKKFNRLNGSLQQSSRQARKKQEVDSEDRVPSKNTRRKRSRNYI